MHRLTWEHAHYDTLIASLQNAALSSGLSMDDLVTFGNLNHKLNASDKDVRTPHEKWKIKGILNSAIALIHKDALIQFFDGKIKYEELSYYFNSDGRDIRLATLPEDKESLENEPIKLKYLLKAYRKELVILQNQPSTSFNPNVYLVHFLREKSMQLTYSIFLHYRKNPASEIINSDELILGNKEQNLKIFSSFYKELQARKYAEDTSIPIDEDWAATCCQIQSMKGFDQSYYNAEDCKLFLEKHILERKTSEGPITKEDINRRVMKDFRYRR